MARRHAGAIVKGEVLRAEEAVVLPVHGLLRLILRVELCIGQALLILRVHVRLLLGRRVGEHGRRRKPPIDPIARQALKHFLRFVKPPAPRIDLNPSPLELGPQGVDVTSRIGEINLELNLALALFRFAPRLDNRRKESQQ